MMELAATKGPRLQKITLASKLGVSRPTLDKYLHMEGAPQPDEKGTWDVEEVTTWIQANAREAGGGTSKDGKPTLNDVRIEKLMLECTKLRNAIEVDRGDYIKKKEAARTIVPLMEELGALMTQIFENELPSRYVGRDAVDCAKLNADGCDKIVKRFREGVKLFTE